MIRIVIVDDHGILRDGLRAALASREDLEVVGDAATGNEGVEIVAATDPDVVIMDLHLPDIDGVTATRRILSAEGRTKVLILTMEADDEALVRALRVGARGYLLKDAGRDEIEWAIRTVAGGGTVFGAAVGERLVQSVGGPHGASLTPFPQLTDKEQEMLELLAQGRSNAEIARALYLSQKTVRNRTSMIFSKLGVADRSQAIICARDAGFGRG